MTAPIASPETSGSGDWFATTHWSVVLAAGQAESPRSRTALEELCKGYWYPLYVFARRQGNSQEDAQDLTQGFFERLLGRNDFAGLDRSLGKFRAFLLASFKHFLLDKLDYAKAAKRGGKNILLSLDAQDAEKRYLLEPIDTMSPDKLYDRRWAYTLIGKARAKHRQEYFRGGKRDLYEALNGLDTREDADQTYSEKAEKLGMSLAAIKSAALRMRQRYGNLLRLEIAQTVANPAEIDEEIRYLLAIVSECE